MNDEILRIQRMVAEGKITPEESVELLESVAPARSPAAPAVPPPLPSQEEMAPAQDFRMGLFQRLASDLFGESVARRHPLPSVICLLGLFGVAIAFAYYFPFPAAVIALVVGGGYWYRHCAWSQWAKVSVLAIVFLFFLSGLTISSPSHRISEVRAMEDASMVSVAPSLRLSHVLAPKSQPINSDGLFGRFLNALSRFAAEQKRYPGSLSELSQRGYLEWDETASVSERVWYSCSSQAHAIPTLKVLDKDWKTKHGEQVQLPKLEDLSAPQDNLAPELPAEQVR